MYDVLVLSIAEKSSCGSSCSGCESACAPRTPVLVLADALRERNARVETVVAGSDAEIDAALARFDGDPRPDGLTWPAADGKHRLVSDVPRLRYAWILISNTVVTIVSFGLLRPWAAVRERRFIAAFTGLWIMGDVEELRAKTHEAR